MSWYRKKYVTRKLPLHLMLVARLVLVSILISSVVSAFIVISEEQRILRAASDRVLIRAGTFRMLVLKQLDAPGTESREEFQSVLEKVAYKGFDLGVGHYVMLRVFDRSLNKIACVMDTANPAMAVLEDKISGEKFIPPPENMSKPEITMLNAGGMRYFRAKLPLLNSQGKVAVYMDGLFATSPAEERALRGQLYREIGLVVGIVFITSLLLYPVIVHLLRRLVKFSQLLVESNMETLLTLGSVIAKRDSDTDIHNFRVTIYAVRIAEALGLDDKTIRILIRGAFLHDIGKVAICDNILLKPGKLTDEEFAEMKLHVNHGIDIVNRSSWIGEALPVVGGHHEKFDGTGYPDGLKKDEIPLLARIFTVVDVFDALTSRRPYKEPYDFEKTVDILKQGRGTHFDPEILDEFLKIARQLYDSYVDKDDDVPRNALSEILDRYYKRDIADFLD